MRNAYALLGISFLIVFGGAYILLSDKAVAPTHDDIVLPANESAMTLTLTSPAFQSGDTIPSVYTCDGDNISPPLSIRGVPEGTQSLVLVMDDPDIPAEVKEKMGIEKFNHWSLYSLPADTTEIPVGEVVGQLGENSRGEGEYTGPCPPTEYEPTEHRYIFRLYALPNELNFIKAPTLDELEAAAKGSALASAELVGVYDRTKNNSD